MQDNQWDEQFIDHGWQEMRKLLDRDMPVLPWWRRRRAGWLALLLLLSLGLGAVYFLGGEGRRRVPQPTATLDKPALNGAASAKEDLKQSNDDERSIDQISTQEMRAAEGTTKANTAQAGDVEAASNEDDPAARISSVTPPGSNTIENVIEDTEEPNAGGGLTQLEEQNQPVSMEIPEINSPSTRQEREALMTIDQLPSGATKLNSTFNLSPVLPADMVTRRRSSFFLVPDQLGVRAAVLSSREGFGSGVEAGLSAGYRFGASRWSLQTGLGYAFQQRDFYRPGHGTMDESSPVAFPQQPGREQDDMEAVQAALPPGGSLAARTHRLSLPANIQFRIGRRWGISTGATVGYVFSAKQKNQVNFQRPTGSFSFSLDRQTYDLLSTAVNQPISEELLRNWEFGLNGGLSFRPSRRILLQLEYHYGLTDLVRSGYYESYNSYLGFGLGYLLK